MKSMISKTLTLVAIAAALFSFTPKLGGEGFEISLNGKVVLQQFGKEMDIVKTLQLHSASPTDQLTIRYYHCGKAGKNRIVTLKDEQNNVVKEWRFKDATGNVSDMSCSVQEILSLNKGNNPFLKLYYSSSELPNGRQLATVHVDSNQDHASLLR